jgi:hypothetical protein
MANKYNEFVSYLKNCPYVYQEQVSHMNDLEDPDT